MEASRHTLKEPRSEAVLGPVSLQPRPNSKRNAVEANHHALKEPRSEAVLSPVSLQPTLCPGSQDIYQKTVTGLFPPETWEKDRGANEHEFKHSILLKVPS